MIPNTNYKNLKDSYLFYHIAQKTKAYLEQHPGAYLYRMGIGDVSLPLCDAVIQALHKLSLIHIYKGRKQNGRVLWRRTDP